MNEIFAPLIAYGEKVHRRVPTTSSRSSKPPSYLQKTGNEIHSMNARDFFIVLVFSSAKLLENFSNAGCKPYQEMVHCCGSNSSS